KVELQAALQTLDRALAMVQAARAQVYAILQSDDIPLPASMPSVAAKKGGGYVHPRTRKAILAEARALKIPEVAMQHYMLLRDGSKPTTEGFKAAEDLITKVKAEKAAGQNPAPLWAPYMPLPPPKASWPGQPG